MSTGNGRRPLLLALNAGDPTFEARAAS